MDYLCWLDQTSLGLFSVLLNTESEPEMFCKTDLNQLSPTQKYYESIVKEWKCEKQENQKPNCPLMLITSSASVDILGCFLSFRCNS